VVPIFAGQLLRGEPLTITDEGMTRYVMTIDDAASLVIEAGARVLGGEVFVTKMNALKVTDLAEAMAEILTPRMPKKTYDFVRTGARPGEKLYEELLAEEEIPRAVDVGRLLVVLPQEESIEGAALRKAYLGPGGGTPIDKVWHSGKDALLSKSDIVTYLKEHRVLEPFVAPGNAP
jgi:FlaA1/EpsC-like NDP-sugar epimerase